MTTITLAEAIHRHGVDVLDHLDRAAIIPVLVGLQIQGDVAFIPTTPSAKPGVAVPAEGIPVVRGDNNGNTHLLLADGPVMFAPVEASPTAAQPDVGVITVPEGATGYVAHPEHGYLGLGTGAYIVRRQVEEAETARIVAD